MTTRRRRLLLLLGIGIPLVVLAAVAVFLLTFDGSGYRSTVEQLVTTATGRDCSIAGDFEIALSLHPRVRAERITLGNAPWSDTPQMVSVDGFALQLEAWSVVSGPLHIEQVAIDGVQVLLEVDPEAGPNWIFEPPPSEDAEDVSDRGGLLDDGLVLDEVAVRDVTVVYRDPESRRTLSIPRFAASTDSTGHLTVELDGALDETPLDFGGRVGPFLHLWAGGAVDAEANGRLGDATLTLGGSIADVATLADPDLTAELQGPELEDLARDLGLPVLSGPYRLAARTTPASGGVDVALDADLDRFDANARGSVDGLKSPSRVEANVTAAGPDLARLGAWLGVDRLPAEAFALNGRVRHDAEGTNLDDVRVEVGAARLTAHGRLGPPPQLAGTALRFELSGPDLAAYSALAEIELPGDPFDVSGQLTWSGDVVAIESVVASIGNDRVEAHGVLSAEPGLSGTNLVFQGGGPTAAHIGKRVGIPLPDEAFSLAGRVRRVEAATLLEGLRVRMGDLEARADGVLGDPPQLAGTELAFHAEGPDLASVGRIADVPLPAGGFAVDGRVTRQREGYGLHQVVARLGDNTARFDGTIGDAVAGTVQAGGPDLAALVGPLLSEGKEEDDLPPLPAAAFDVAGRIRMDDAGYRLEGMQATLGDVAVELTGRVGREPEFAGLDATLSVAAESLALLEEYVDLPPLPEGRLTVDGRVTSTRGVYALHDVRGSLAETRFTVDGTLGDLEDVPNGIEATFDVAGPDLAAFAALSPDFALPAVAYRAAGRVEVGDAGYRLSGVTAELGPARARLAGLLGPPPELRGSDLAVEVDGILLAWFEELAGRPLPEQPVRLAGRIARTDAGVRFDRVEAAMGEHRLEAHGELGEPPHFEGTDLAVRGAGPDLTPFAYFTDFELPPMPDERYDVSARFDGTPEAFALHDLAFHFGESDISGALTLDLHDPPTLTGELVSQNLDLRPFFPEPAADPTGETTADTSPAEQPPAREERVFTDDPIDLSVLELANADVRLRGGTLTWPDGGSQSIDVSVKLQDGSLAIDPIDIRDHGIGVLSATFSIVPDSTGYRLTTVIRGEHLRLGLLGHHPVDPMLEPESRTEIVLETSGATPHELAVNLDGYFWLTQGPGQIDNEALGLISMDVLSEIFNSLNPFAKDEEYTDVECGVYVVDFSEGISTIEAIALRTNKLTMGARGLIDLESERLELTWTSKPRKGVGLSAGVIANAYLKLGGSLAHPQLELRPLHATAAAGAAVATAGLSVVAAGLWDRATSGKKVCKKALKQIDKHIAERETRTTSPASGS